MSRLNIFVLVCILLVTSNWVMSQVKLPKVFSDNMVLQRDLPVKIWGWAKANEKVSISFNNQKLSSKANKDGKWLITLLPMKFGGPFEMTIKASNELKLRNILIGDVWVCSGQSNMEWPLSKVNSAVKEMTAANFPNIRLFTVPKKISGSPLDDCEPSNWLVCDSASASWFSAVGYFFGRNLNQKLEIPIGLIHTSWGGTDIETWMNVEAIGQSHVRHEPRLSVLQKAHLTKHLPVDNFCTVGQ